MSDWERLSALARHLGFDDDDAPCLLVVDDEAENVQLLAALLAPLGRVCAAGSAAEAMTLLEREPFDVVVTDHRMPGMTGVELLEQIRARHPDTLGVLTTAWADVETLQRAVNHAGVFRVLCKPYDADELVAVVEQARRHVRSVQMNRGLLTLLSARSEALQRALDELRCAQQKMVHLDRLSTVGRLTAGITHDLRNAMQGLVMLEDDFARLEVPPLVSECLRVGVAGMRNLLGSLRTVHQYGGGSIALVESDLRVEQLLRDAEVVSRMDPARGARTLRIVPSAGLPPMRGDHPKLVQVLVNLVRNAMQATGPGGTVVLEAVRCRDGVLISVDDDGPGVSPEIRARLFEPFSSTKGDLGVGIGLYMARLVAASHGGTLECAPTPGPGARFELWLPAAGAVTA